MRNAGGYALLTTPEGVRGTCEADTFTCVHCNRVIHVKPKASPDAFGSMCRNCMKMVCPACADGSCVPFEMKLEQWERRAIALRSYGLG